MADIVLISDPRVLAIEVRDCGEPLVDLRPTVRVDHRSADAAGALRPGGPALTTRG